MAAAKPVDVLMVDDFEHRRAAPLVLAPAEVQTAHGRNGRRARPDRKGAFGHICPHRREQRRTYRAIALPDWIRARVRLLCADALEDAFDVAVVRSGIGKALRVEVAEATSAFTSANPLACPAPTPR